jgi:large repetitive protein
MSASTQPTTSPGCPTRCTTTRRVPTPWCRVSRRVRLTSRDTRKVPQFLCRVTDSDAIQVESTITVVIENLDTVDPGLSLSALSTGDAPAGHVELEGDSLYDGADPDVSGTILLKGTASDNQRIAAVTVTITSFDAGSGTGAERTLASWSGGTLVSGDANFSITSQSLTESGGHQVSWTYTWNTAGVTNSAARNIDVLFKAQDFSARTATGSRTHDVVPYIRSVSTQAGGIKDGNIRSVLGRYSIRQNLVDNADLITVRGYNLRPIANGVRVSSDRDGLVGTTLQGSALTVESAANPWTTLTVRKNSSRSGYLAVVAGTAGAPVASLNNVNADRSYNREPDIYSGNSLLTDDRYLNFFIVTKTAYTNGYYPDMVMNGDTPVFAYCNDTTGAVLRSGTVIANGWYHRMNALARDSSGNYYQASVHDAFGSGNYGHLNLYYNAYGGGAWPYTNPGSTGNTNNALALDNLTFTATKLNRYHYPKLIANGTSASAQVYLAYYDDETSTRDLLVRVFQIGTGVTQTRALAGGVWSNQVEAVGDGTAGTAGTENGRNLVAGSASQFFDMGLTGSGVLVVAYYDEAANQLKFTYNANPVNGNGRYAGSFAAPLDLDVTYNGTYVSLAVDAFDHIHIAYYDSADADLKYIYLDSYVDTTPSIARVDAYHSIGPWTDIRTTAAGVPSIAYYNNSENGTRDSIKLATYLGSLPTVSDGVDGSGAVTGSWECLTVPTRDVPQGGLPQFNRVNLGFDASSDPTLGYLADAVEYSNYLPEIP